MKLLNLCNSTKIIVVICTLSMIIGCSSTKNRPSRSPCVSNEYSTGAYQSPCGDRKPVNNIIT